MAKPNDRYVLMIETTAALEEACAKLARSEFVTVDTEFIRESTFWPELCLIQMASPDMEVLVDPLARGIDLKPFFELMADPSVVKVFHAARQDLEIVYHMGGLLPAPLFDTQVAAIDLVADLIDRHGIALNVLSDVGVYRGGILESATGPTGRDATGEEKESECAQRYRADARRDAFWCLH